MDLLNILFNNEIFGLTKGLYSPTSRSGTRSPSTPAGSIDAPISPTEFAIGCGARFVARGIDSQQKQLPQLLIRAKEHKGASFVEVLQNCIVYNDGIYADFTQKSMVEERQVAVKHGKPLLFGKDGNKGIRLKPGHMEVEVVTVGIDDIEEKDILVHDETNKMLAHLLASMESPEFPVAVGVLYCEPGPTYDEGIYSQVDDAIQAQPKASLNELLRTGSTWTVE